MKASEQSKPSNLYQNICRCEDMGLSDEETALEQQRLLAAAEELRLKRETARETGVLTKNQLKKTRRKLSRLYHQALQKPGLSVLGDNSMLGTEFSEDALQVFGVPAPAASDFTDTSVTCCQGPTPASHSLPEHDAASTQVHDEHAISIDPPYSSQAHGIARATAVLPGVAPGSRPLMAWQRPAPINSTAGRGRGRNMDLSGVMHVLNAQLVPTTQAVGSTAEKIAGIPTRMQRLPTLSPNAQITDSQNQAATPAVQCQQPYSSTGGGEEQQPAVQGSETQATDSTCSGQPSGSTKRPRKQFIYGNYHGYYGYRHASVTAFEDDPRLSLLQPDWFTGRHLLDVGCNEGLVTLAAAVRWGPASTTGVDIDPALVGKAGRNLRTLRAQITDQIHTGIIFPDHTSHKHQRFGQTNTMARQQHTSWASTGAVVVAGQTSVVVSQPSNCSADTDAAVIPVASMDTQPTAASLRKPLALTLAHNHSVQAEQAATESDMPSNTNADGDGGEGGSAIPSCDEQGQWNASFDTHVDGDEGAYEEEEEGAAGPSQRKRSFSSQAELRPGTTCTSSWPALRTAARALSAVHFHTQDWANQDQPSVARRQQGGRGGGGGHAPRVRQEFGVIMCLSVTKWVHLNWGDEGLVRLFNKFNASLEPGGYLILEPQPWRSYQQALVKKHTAGVAVQDLKALTLRPEDFPRLLVQDLGFHLVADLNKSNTAVGFDRPMYVFQKITKKTLLPAQVPALGLGLTSPSVAASDPPSSGLASTVGTVRRGPGGGNRRARRQHRPEDLLVVKEDEGDAGDGQVVGVDAVE